MSNNHLLRNSIQVINFDNKSNKDKRKVEMFPNVIHCGMFGPSGAGKSNLLLTMLVHVRPYKNLYLCSKTSYQEKYATLKELIAEHNKGKKKSSQKINIHELQIEGLLEPEELESDSIVIFDDVLTEKQDKVANFFLRGRHRNISCFYLSQAYTKIPKKTGIRENFNYVILFRQDLVNLRQVYTEYVTDVSFDKFRSMCNSCWREPYGFLVIDADNEKCKYKKKFEACINT